MATNSTASRFLKLKHLNGACDGCKRILDWMKQIGLVESSEDFDNRYGVCGALVTSSIPKGTDSTPCQGLSNGC